MFVSWMAGCVRRALLAAAAAALCGFAAGLQIARRVKLAHLPPPPFAAHLLARRLLGLPCSLQFGHLRRPRCLCSQLLRLPRGVRLPGRACKQATWDSLTAADAQQSYAHIATAPLCPPCPPPQIPRLPHARDKRQPQPPATGQASRGPPCRRRLALTLGSFHASPPVHVEEQLQHHSPGIESSHADAARARQGTTHTPVLPWPHLQRRRKLDVLLLPQLPLCRYGHGLNRRRPAPLRPAGRPAHVGGHGEAGHAQRGKVRPASGGSSQTAVPGTHSVPPLP